MFVLENKQMFLRKQEIIKIVPIVYEKLIGMQLVIYQMGGE